MTSNREVTKHNDSNNNKLGLRLIDFSNHFKCNKCDRLSILNSISHNLLGQSIQKTLHDATNIIHPFVSTYKKRKTLHICSASTCSKSWEIENSLIKSNDNPRPIDIPGGIGTRIISMSAPQDTVVISSLSEKKVTSFFNNVDIIDTCNDLVFDNHTCSDMYYKQEALLGLLLRHECPNIKRLMKAIKTNPVINIYAMDEETVLLLSVLINKAGINHLDVKANSPKLSLLLNNKSIRYPSCEKAWKMKYSNNYLVTQDHEWQLSKLAKLTNYNFQIDQAPGYYIKSKYDNQYWKSLIMHSLRYDFDKVWRKPAIGTDGVHQGVINITLINKGIKTKIKNLISIDDQQAINLFIDNLVDKNSAINALRDIHNIGGDWVIEACVDNFKIQICNDKYPCTITTSPSVHLVNGKVNHHLTLQLTDKNEDGTCQWAGNIIIDESKWRKLVMKTINTSDKQKDELFAAYTKIIKTMENLAEIINQKPEYKNQYVRGAYDVAIGMLGGKYKNKVMTVMQDNNARANGGDTANALYLLAQKKFGSQACTVTRNVTPYKNYKDMLTCLQIEIAKLNTEGYKISKDQLHLLGLSVGWAQFGLIGNKLFETIKLVSLIENGLRKHKAIA
ncbi:hypothetical protein IPM62_03100 [Candidatus Woesebacteria bacterium]|nr:MAG: hypothetical protein IPM62_03100 [Candidatus Woesebacteria bacterium]